MRLSVQKALTAFALAGCLAMPAHVAETKPLTTPAGKMPLVHWAVLRAKPGAMREMMGMAARNVAPLSAQEPGTYALYGGMDKRAPNVVRLLEIYEDEAAYEAHVGSDGFRKYKEEREPLLEELDILPVDPVVLEQKESGTGADVILRLYAVKPEHLAAFTTLLAEEMRRGVAEDVGVMGLFATAEQGRANMIHTYELFADEAARASYRNSPAYRAFWEKARPMLYSSSEVENLPGKVTLSQKGFHEKR